MKLYNPVEPKTPGVLFGYEREDWDGLRIHEWMHLHNERLFFPRSLIESARVPADLNAVADFDGGIYFLFNGENLEYIGQAKVFHDRLKGHVYPNPPSKRKAEWLTHWSLIWTPAALMNDIEYFYVNILTPPRNVKRLGHSPELNCYRQRVMK